jgi:hypothetical protein
MSNVVGEIVIDVTADVGPLMRNMNKAEGAMTGLQGAAGRMGRGLQGAGSMALSFGRNMAVVAAGVAAVTGAAIAFVRSSAAFGDAIGDASKAAGMSTTAFQEYRFALKEAADMTDEDFASAAARLNKTLGDARDGSLGAVKAFEAIGVSQAQLADASFTTDQAMAAYVATMEGMKDPTLAAAVSADLFGRAGAGMGAALSGVPGQVGSLVDRARELGVVLGPEAVAAAGEFDQKMNELTASFEMLKMKMANDLMPVLVNSVLPAIEDYVIPALETLGGAVAGAAELIVIFAQKTGQAFTAFKDGAAAAVDYVVGKFQAFMTMLDTVLAKLGQIGTAIAETLGGPNSFGAGGNPDMQRPAEGGWMQEQFGSGHISGGGPGVGGAMGGQMLGASIVTGALLGATTAMEENRAAFMSIFSQIPQIARETLGINSPSKVFEEIGGFLGQGLAQGIEASNAMVATAVSAMGAGAVAATNGTVSDILVRPRHAAGRIEEGRRGAGLGEHPDRSQPGDQEGHFRLCQHGDRSGPWGCAGECDQGRRRRRARARIDGHRIDRCSGSPGATGHAEPWNHLRQRSLRHRRAHRAGHRHAGERSAAQRHPAERLGRSLI